MRPPRPRCRLPRMLRASPRTTRVRSCSRCLVGRVVCLDPQAVAQERALLPSQGRAPPCPRYNLPRMPRLLTQGGDRVGIGRFSRALDLSGDSAATVSHRNSTRAARRGCCTAVAPTGQRSGCRRCPVEHDDGGRAPHGPRSPPRPSPLR